MCTRRKFLAVVFPIVIASLGSLTVCQSPENNPRPFKTGQVVAPPAGCTELRKRDKDGDCG